MQQNNITYPLIKNSSRNAIESLSDVSWDRLLRPVNAIQQTPWRINTKMYDVLQWSFNERGGGFVDLPEASDTPLPPIPWNYDTDEEVKKAHNKRVFMIRNANRQSISKRMSVLTNLSVAKAYLGKTFWYPHKLDSRGRIYPVAAYGPQPQGADWSKSLIEFANGLPIETEDQAAWLAISGANAYGQDKLPLQSRADWVSENHDMIMSVADNPKKDLRWTEASEPFAFLRFALEWRDFYTEGYGFVSHIVCCADATASGIQHYSAMLLDGIGGEAVNLVPDVGRQDIYQRVADKTIAYLMVEGSPQANNLVAFGIDRSTVKRQVMTRPYASTLNSCTAYTRDALEDRANKGHHCPWSMDDEAVHKEHVNLLSQTIWKSIKDVVIKASEAMEWLSLCSREHTKWSNKQKGNAYSKRIHWVTPDGFPVTHVKPDKSKGIVRTALDGGLQLVMYKDLDRLNWREMSQSIAPNFVHSMDACLLRMTVNNALNKGIKDFAMIHDSFGTHAANIRTLIDHACKEAFIEMYHGRDVLHEFAMNLPEEVREKIPPAPAKGNLDLLGVAQCDYFFS